MFFKMSLILVCSFLSIQSFGYEVKKFPRIPIKDALGIKYVSIEGFCMTANDEVLIGRVRICKKASFNGHNGKRCTSRATLEVVEVTNNFTDTWHWPRGASMENSYQISRNQIIDIVDFDPRGAETPLGEFSYQIPFCK